MVPTLEDRNIERRTRGDRGVRAREIGGSNDVATGSTKRAPYLGRLDHLIGGLLGGPSLLFDLRDGGGGRGEGKVVVSGWNGSGVWGASTGHVFKYCYCTTTLIKTLITVFSSKSQFGAYACTVL